jgi:hypothetical protein
MERHCYAACDLPRDFAMTTRDFFALHYHVRESTADWMVRVTDDTMVNFRAIASYIRNLSLRYRTDVDIVVRGNCVSYYSFLYPQGGSGILFSRAASRHLMNGYETILVTFQHSEDIAFGWYLIEKGLKLTDIVDPHFMGLGWNSLTWFRNDLGNAERGCPEIDLERFDCVKKFVEPLNNVVFFHHQGGRPRNVDALRVSKKVFNVNRSVMWYSGENSWPRLCIV